MKRGILFLLLISFEFATAKLPMTEISERSVNGNEPKIAIAKYELLHSPAERRRAELNKLIAEAEAKPLKERALVIEMTPGDSRRFKWLFRPSELIFPLADRNFLITCEQKIPACKVHLFNYQAGRFKTFHRNTEVEDRQGQYTKIPFNGNNFIHREMSSLSDRGKQGFYFTTLADGKKFSIAADIANEKFNNFVDHRGWEMGVYEETPERRMIRADGFITVTKNFNLNIADTPKQRLAAPGLNFPEAGIFIYPLPNQVEGIKISVDGQAKTVLRDLFYAAGFFTIDKWDARDAAPKAASEYAKPFESLVAVSPGCGPKGRSAFTDFARLNNTDECFFFVHKNHPHLKTTENGIELEIRRSLPVEDPFTGLTCEWCGGNTWIKMLTENAPWDGPKLQTPQFGNLEVHMGNVETTLSLNVGYEVDGVKLVVQSPGR